MKKTIKIKTNMLNSQNVDVMGATFMKHYMAATQVFNGFYGTMSMIANNALTEAADAYEGTKVYKHDVKKAFKDAIKSWSIFWGRVRYLFEEKHEVYIDFISQAVKDMETDIQKLYIAVHQSLLRQRIPDADRKAWLYSADILTHELNAIFARYLEGLVKETKLPKLAETFMWADPQHVTRQTHDLLKRLCPVEITMDDNVTLAMQVIATKALSSERQDAAAIRALEYDCNENYREKLSKDIERYKEHIAEKEREKREANEAYKRKKEQEQARRKRSKSETLTGEQIASRLGDKFNVKRI